MSLLVLGTVALDSVNTPSGQRKEMLGGSAAHFSMSARLFTRVNLVSVIGQDFPRAYIRLLKSRGIILAGLSKVKGPTFRWQGDYRKDYNSAITIKTELGVLGDFKPNILEYQKDIRNIFLANVDPDIQRYVLNSMRNPTLVGLDSMNYWIDNKRKQLLRVMKKVHLLLVNDQEARSLSGQSNLFKAAKGLLSLGPKMIVIKKGEHGVIFYSKGITFCLPAYPILEVVDPTGAGDTFAGALMGYLATHDRTAFHIKKALGFACVCASFNVLGFGLDKTVDLTRGRLQSRLKKFKTLLLTS